MATSFPAPRYQFDPTGVHPNNKVVGETKQLTLNRPVRAFVPRYAAFYTQSVVLYDADNNRQLTRGDDADFVFADYVRVGFEQTGKAMATTILVINPDVSPNLRIDYQVVGGYYQNTVTGIENLYETLIQDSRGVEWKNIIDKPWEFTPVSNHLHLLSEIIGFQYLVAAVDRLSDAVTLSNVPAFEALKQWIIDNLPLVATLQELESGLPLANKVLSIEGLQFVLQKYNFNSMVLSPSKGTKDQGDLITFDLTSTHIDDGSTLYWRIKHGTTNDADFSAVSGSMVVFDNKTTFGVHIADSNVSEATERFQVEIRRQSINGPVMMTSGVFVITGISLDSRNDAIEGLINCCPGALPHLSIPAYYANRSGKSPVY